MVCLRRSLPAARQRCFVEALGFQRGYLGSALNLLCPRSGDQKTEDNPFCSGWSAKTSQLVCRRHCQSQPPCHHCRTRPFYEIIRVGHVNPEFAGDGVIDATTNDRLDIIHREPHKVRYRNVFHVGSLSQYSGEPPALHNPPDRKRTAQRRAHREPLGPGVWDGFEGAYPSGDAIPNARPVQAGSVVAAPVRFELSHIRLKATSQE
jgi:hypothetical protein